MSSDETAKLEIVSESDGKELKNDAHGASKDVRQLSKPSLRELESDELVSKRIKTGDGIGNVVASHYNKIEDKGLQERNLSRIVYMRNFNNWIKSVLIIKYLEQIRDQSADEHRIVALDLGCGKGGDLLKWQKGNIRHLICADIASNSIVQCQDRYEHMKQKGKIFSAEFIVADCTKARLKNHIKYSEMKVDIVSCQFSFHYCFESLAQTETMVRNASEMLRKGGFFIATIPDANKIVSSLQASGKNTFGNEVFRIEFPEDRDPAAAPLFGDKYNFFLEDVVNCPEFLVHFPTLKRLCQKYGLELVFKKSFADLCHEGLSNRETRSLLFRMKALEVYPPPSGASLSSSNEEEYSHARDYMDEANVRSVKTLSKSEWEAVGLYMGFAFKKVT